MTDRRRHLTDTHERNERKRETFHFVVANAFNLNEYKFLLLSLSLSHTCTQSDENSDSNYP